MHYDMEDLLEQANEVQATLGRSYAVPDEIDEADLEAGMFPSPFFFFFGSSLRKLLSVRTRCSGFGGGRRRSIVSCRS